MIRMQTTRQRELRLLEALKAAGYTVRRGKIGGYTHARVIQLGNFQVQPSTASMRQPITA